MSVKTKDTKKVVALMPLDAAYTLCKSMTTDYSQVLLDGGLIDKTTFDSLQLKFASDEKEARWDDLRKSQLDVFKNDKHVVDLATVCQTKMKNIFGDEHDKVLKFSLEITSKGLAVVPNGLRSRSSSGGGGGGRKYNITIDDKPFTKWSDACKEFGWEINGNSAFRVVKSKTTGIPSDHSKGMSDHAYVLTSK